jgi:hypothetical protein
VIDELFVIKMVRRTDVSVPLYGSQPFGDDFLAMR